MMPVKFNQTVITSTVRLVLGVLVIGAMMFLPGGTWNYWQAWAWLVALFTPMTFSFAYLIKQDRNLLERRVRTHETRSAQKWIIVGSTLCLLIVFVLPGFDVRFGWSQVPAWVSLAADGVVVLAFAFYNWVLKTNTFASRVIEVESGQQVITNGPYALVRHPMYLSMLLMIIASPIALGSYWAALPCFGFVLLLAARAKNEEELLIRDLKGYREYMQKTRYRLFPGVW